MDRRQALVGASQIEINKPVREADTQNAQNVNSLAIMTP